MVALATICYMLWGAWQADYGPKPTLSTLDRPVIEGNAQQGKVATLNPTVSVVAEAKIAAAAIIKVKTDLFAIEIDSVGGTIRHLDLLQYPIEKENTIADPLKNAAKGFLGMKKRTVDLTPTRLFNTDAQKEFLAQSGLIADGGSDAALSRC